MSSLKFVDLPVMAIADEAPLLQTETISIEYPKHACTLKKIEDKLIELSNDRHNVFFGDDNFTFSVGFVASRKARKYDPWERITSTPYKPANIRQETKKLPQFSTVQVQCMENSFSYHNQVMKWLSNKLDHLGHSIDVDISGDKCLLNNIRILSELPEPNDNWKTENPRLDPPSVLWLQCLPQANFDTLWNDYIIFAQQNTHEGDLVCLGITKHKKYVQQYYLERILGEYLCGIDNSTPLLEDFHFLGADTELIAEILSYGYCHQSGNIHDTIILDHVTLVFKRKKHPPQPHPKH